MIVLLLVLYGICASITTFDTRLIQAKLQDSNESQLPKWVAIFYWIEWGLLISIAVLNWRIALIAFVVKFILKVLPVLEIIGNILMTPFKLKK